MRRPVTVPSLRKNFIRFAVVAFVLALHVLLGAGLWQSRHRSRSPEELVMASITLFPQELTAGPQTKAPEVGQGRMAAHSSTSSAIAIPMVPDMAGRIPPADWNDSARRAAAKVATDLIFDKPAEQPAKPFAWDIAKTKRWEADPAGGTRIRLNDHCELVLMPLPVGGCALGKIEPRGDLFDGMSSRNASGDWDQGSVPRVEPRAGGLIFK